MDLKAAAARAERWLERYAEPFAALHGAHWPGEFLELAWRKVIENSAHDSICGCSADEVSAQVLARYAEAEALGRDLAREALAGAAASAPRGSAVVANPSPFTREEVVELEFVVPADWEDVALELPDGGRVATQELDRTPPHFHRVELLGREIPELLRRRMHGRELFGRWLNAYAVEEGPRLVLDLDRERDPVWLDATQLRGEIDAAAEGRAGRALGGRPADEAAPAPPRARAGAAPRVDDGPPGSRARGSEPRARPARSHGARRRDAPHRRARGRRPHRPRLRLRRLVQLRRARGRRARRHARVRARRDPRGRAAPYGARRHAHVPLAAGPRRAGRAARRAPRRRALRPHPDRVRQPRRRPARARPRAARARRRPLVRGGPVRRCRARYDGRGRLRRSAAADVPRCVVRGGRRRRAPARARVGVRAARGPRARAHRPALDGADQQEHEPLSRGPRRPRARDPCRADARPPLLLVRDLPLRGRTSRPRRARAGRALPSPVPHRRLFRRRAQNFPARTASSSRAKASS